MPPHPVPWPYRIFHTTIEPCLALSGAYLSQFQQGFYFLQVAPPISIASSLPLSPLAELTLAQVASLYVQFAMAELLVLRNTDDMKVWRGMVASILAGDIGHLWACYIALGAEFWRPNIWRQEDWVTIGLTWFGFILRICFLLGVGVKKVNKKRK